MPKKTAPKCTEPTQSLGKYLNPFTDFGFKKLFGEEANKDLLIDFLNELLATQGQHIKTLSYKNGALLGQTGLDRKVVYDLYCENDKGEKFIVELQKAKQEFFKDRMVFYSSFSIQEQGVRGTEWNYELKKVYVIGILDFVIDDTCEEKHVVSNHKLMDVERNSIFYDKLMFVTIQMPHFTKTEEELVSNFDKWLYVIKNLDRLDRIPERIKNKIFEKLFKVAEVAKMTPEDRTAYQESMAYYRDIKNVIDYAKKEGLQEAEELFAEKISSVLAEKDLALAEAEKERSAKDHAIAEKEKATQTIIDMVKGLSKMNIGFERISELTKLNEENILQILDEE